MSYSQVLSASVNLPVAGIIDIEGSAKQAFSTTADASWGFQILIDGEVVYDFGGTARQDIVPLSAWKFCQAGQRQIALRWAGDPSITLGPRFMKVRGFNSASGA